MTIQRYLLIVGLLLAFVVIGAGAVVAAGSLVTFSEAVRRVTPVCTCTLRDAYGTAGAEPDLPGAFPPPPHTVTAARPI